MSKTIEDFFRELCREQPFSLQVNDHQGDYIDISSALKGSSDLTHDTLNDCIKQGTCWDAREAPPPLLMKDTLNTTKGTLTAPSLIDFFNIDILDDQGQKKILFLNDLCQHIFRERFLHKDLKDENFSLSEHVSMGYFHIVSDQDFLNPQENAYDTFDIEDYDISPEDIKKSGVVFVSHLYNSLNGFFSTASASFEGMIEDITKYGVRKKLLDPSFALSSPDPWRDFLFDTVGEHKWNDGTHDVYRTQWTLAARRSLREKLPDSTEKLSASARLI